MGRGRTDVPLPLYNPGDLVKYTPGGATEGLEGFTYTVATVVWFPRECRFAYIIRHEDGWGRLQTSTVTSHADLWAAENLSSCPCMSCPYAESGMEPEDAKPVEITPAKPTLPPFPESRPGDSCPKCTTHTEKCSWHTRWGKRLAAPETTAKYDLTGVADFLVWTCSQCGYAWPTLCADAPQDAKGEG